MIFLRQIKKAARGKYLCSQYYLSKINYKTLCKTLSNIYVFKKFVNLFHVAGRKYILLQYVRKRRSLYA